MLNIISMNLKFRSFSFKLHPLLQSLRDSEEERVEGHESTREDTGLSTPKDCHPVKKESALSKKKVGKQK